jgi:hypothetical protein
VVAAERQPYNLRSGMRPHKERGIERGGCSRSEAQYFSFTGGEIYGRPPNQVAERGGQKDLQRNVLQINDLSSDSSWSSILDEAIVAKGS